MPDKYLYVTVSVDCERIRSESYRNDGTASWETGKRAVLGLAELLEAEGMKGTFLPTPATAARQAGLFHQVRAAGHEVGMQFHTDSFRDGSYTQVLGEYGAEEQRQILSEAKADWEEALGLPLLSYRSGYLSASDATFPILADLGVKACSCSKPGRYRPEIAAWWYGALPYPHRTHAAGRLLAGDLDLVEVPVTSHPGERFSSKPSFDPRELRPDSQHDPAVYREIVDLALWEMEMLAPPLHSIVILTHNTIDYTVRDDPRRDLLLQTLRHIRGKADQGWEIVPATLSDVRSAYEEVSHRDTDYLARP
ncbi:MAG: polysaccharide deacetylase family protein [Anaerolineae bacterium]